MGNYGLVLFNNRVREKDKVIYENESAHTRLKPVGSADLILASTPRISTSTSSAFTTGSCSAAFSRCSSASPCTGPSSSGGASSSCMCPSASFWNSASASPPCSPFHHVSGEDMRHPTEDGVAGRNTYLAPAHEDPAALRVRPPATEDTADTWPGGYEHPRSHITVHNVLKPRWLTRFNMCKCWN